MDSLWEDIIIKIIDGKFKSYYQENSQLIDFEALEIWSNLIINSARDGKLNILQNINECFNLYKSKIWPDLYYLLCMALKHNHDQVAYWLISLNCPVNRTNKNDLSDTPLHLATQNNNEKMVKTLIQKGANLNEKNYIGDIPLHLSCLNNNLLITKLLLKDLESIEAKNSVSNTPFHVAVEKGNIQIINLFLSLNKNLNIDAVTYKSLFKGFTPLHIAIKTRNKEVAQLLLNEGANINSFILCKNIFMAKKSYYGYNAMHLAVEMKDISIVNLLISYGANINDVMKNYEVTSFHKSVEKKDIEMVALLLLFNANYSLKTVDDKNIIHLAAENNFTEVLKIFGKFVNLNDKTKTGDTPLHCALEKKNNDFVKMLLEYNADVKIKNFKGQSPLHIACKYSVELTKLILENGANVNDSNCCGETPLFIAIKSENPDIVSVILQFKPDVYDNNNKLAYLTAYNLYNKKNNDYSVLKIITHLIHFGFHSNVDGINISKFLHAVLMQNDIEVAKIVLKNNIDLNASVNISEKSNLLLHLSVIYNNFHMTQLLIKNGCDINLIDCYKKSALCYAIENNNLNIINLLLASGAKITDSNLLFLNAVQKNNLLLVQLLVKYNFDINSHDEFGTTALHFATWNKLPKLVNFLLRKGAKHIASDKNKNKGSEALLQEENDLYFKILKKQIFTSPLHIAVNKTCQNILITLLEHHFDVNVYDGYGRTALHVATAMKSIKQKNIIKILLKYGADVNSLDNNQKLPIYYIDNPTCVCSIAFQNQYDLYSECECHISDNFDYQDVLTVFVQHISILSFLNKFVHKDNFKIIRSNEFSEKLHFSCILEITKMKETIIYDKVTFFDILIKKSNSLAALARNKQVIKAFKLSNYDEMFPIYSDILEEQYKLAKYRNTLLEFASNAFNEILELQVPDIVIKKIFDFLQCYDLENIINAYEEPNTNTNENSDAISKKIKL